MAVAVKNPPITGVTSPLDRLPIVSLVGAAYVAVSLGDGPQRLARTSGRTYAGLTDVGGNILLGLVMLVVLIGLAVLGVRLFGRHRPAGAGRRLHGQVGILIVLLLARWASLWLEYWIYVNGWFGNSPIVGLAATAAVAAILFAGEVYLFLRPRDRGVPRRAGSAGVVARPTTKASRGSSASAAPPSSPSCSSAGRACSR